MSASSPGAPPPAETSAGALLLSLVSCGVNYVIGTKILGINTRNRPVPTKGARSRALGAGTAAGAMAEMRHRGLRSPAGEVRQGRCGGRNGWHAPSGTAAQAMRSRCANRASLGIWRPVLSVRHTGAGPVNPTAVGRASFGAPSARSPERSAHRGPHGASLKHRARDADGSADLRLSDYSASLGVARRRGPWVRADKPAQSAQAYLRPTPAFRAPSFFSGVTERTTRRAIPAPTSIHRGGAALAWPE